MQQFDIEVIRPIIIEYLQSKQYDTLIVAPVKCGSTLAGKYCNKNAFVVHRNYPKIFLIKEIFKQVMSVEDYEAFKQSIQTDYANGYLYSDIELTAYHELHEAVCVIVLEYMGSIMSTQIINKYAIIRDPFDKLLSHFLYHYLSSSLTPLHILVDDSEYFKYSYTKTLLSDGKFCNEDNIDEFQFIRTEDLCSTFGVENKEVNSMRSDSSIYKDDYLALVQYVTDRAISPELFSEIYEGCDAEILARVYSPEYIEERRTALVNTNGNGINTIAELLDIVTGTIRIKSGLQTIDIDDPETYYHTLY